MTDISQNPNTPIKPVITDAGGDAHMMPASDDASAGPVELGFPINFFGTVYTSVYVNTNGNVTFLEPLYKYLPFDLTKPSPPIIAPFLADVDVRAEASGRVKYGFVTFEGRRAFCVNWLDVGYHWARTDKLNRFQLLLVDRSELGFGEFDIVMNYDRMVWEAGEAAGGSEGLGGFFARAGFSGGTGDTDTYFQFPGALVRGGLLDANGNTGLTRTKTNSNINGRHIFRMRGGRIEVPQPQGEVKQGSKIKPRAVLLPNGLVLAFGDWNRLADVFDPSSNTWEATSPSTANRRHHTATLLPDGRVFVTGTEAPEAVKTTELYDCNTGTWKQAKPMDVGRYDHTATLVKKDGKDLVLVVGGQDANNTRHASAKLYDPSTDDWMDAGTLRTARSAHTATLLPDGQVLVTGGVDANNNSLTSAELYHPETGWRVTGSMGLARRGHTATLVEGERVLVAGGERVDFSDENPKPGTAEVYNCQTHTWEATGGMKHPRRNHTATLLRTGHVLVVGGYHEGAGGHQAGIELYDPLTGSWLELAPMNVRREYHATVLLKDDRVLIVGGTSPDKQGTYEVYFPRYPRR
ncbi:MAG TPA: kelch repeat-containing protein [Archangium sp.]|nr:kelch repeat-containing protein [Archangium sp.]